MPTKFTFSANIKNFSIENTDNPDFFNITCFAISEGININKTSFTLDGMQKSIPSFFNKPILAYFNPQTKDVEEHNSDTYYDFNTGRIEDSYLGVDSERPCGLIRNEDVVEIVEHEGKMWIKFTAGLWAKYNRELIGLLKGNGKKKISVEIDSLSSHIEGNVEVIDEFCFNGCTILGNKRGSIVRVNEGIEGAHLDIGDINLSNDAMKRLSYVFANKSEDVKDNKGNGLHIGVSINADSVSNDNWESVDKISLREELLNAENSDELIKSAYLYVGPDYKTSPSESLKYPVCQIKDGKLVYNINGIKSASQMLMSNKEESYFSKVVLKLNKIRKKLKLNPLKTRMKEVKRMSEEVKKIELAKTDKFTIFANEDKEDGKLYISKTDEKGEEKTYSLFASIFKDEADKDGEGIEDKDDDESEDFACHIAKFVKTICAEKEMAESAKTDTQKEFSALEKKVMALEEEKDTREKMACKEMAKKFACDEKFADVKEEDKEKIVKMAEEKKMSEDDVKKEFAFLDYKAKEEKAEAEKAGKEAKEEEDKEKKKKFTENVVKHNFNSNGNDIFTEISKI